LVELAATFQKSKAVRDTFSDPDGHNPEYRKAHQQKGIAAGPFLEGLMLV
jgi:hypothetical protein